MWGVGVGVAGAQSASRQHVVTAAAGAIPTSVAATFEVTVGRGGHTTTIRGSGQADLAHAALVGTVVLPAMGHLLTTPTPLTVELVGSTIYVKVPAQFARFVGGATWVSIAVPAAQAAHLGADFTAVATGLGDTDDILALHTGTLTPLGTKVIDGVTATGTRGNFPVAALLAALPGVSSSLGTGLSHLGTISLPLSLWAGPDGRLLQVTVADTLSTKGGPVTVSAEVDLSGYDSPVSIQPPPSGSVTALPSGARRHAGRSLRTCRGPRELVGARRSGPPGRCVELAQPLVARNGHRVGYLGGHRLVGQIRRRHRPLGPQPHHQFAGHAVAGPELLGPVRPHVAPADRGGPATHLGQVLGEGDGALQRHEGVGGPIVLHTQRGAPGPGQVPALGGVGTGVEDEVVVVEGEPDRCDVGTAVGTDGGEDPGAGGRLAEEGPHLGGGQSVKGHVTFVGRGRSQGNRGRRPRPWRRLAAVP